MSLEVIMEELGQALLEIIGGIGAATILIWLLSYVTGF